MAFTAHVAFMRVLPSFSRSCLSLLPWAGVMAFAFSSWAQDSSSDRDVRIARLLPDLDRTAKVFAESFATPGMAIAVVTPDHAHFLTYGVREMGRPATIDTSTIFQLASVSKPITSTFAAVLVSQKRLQWTTPITEFLPSFTFADAEVTRKTTVLDMLSQRSGLPGETGDFLETLGYGQDRILRQMRYVSTARNFRKQWAYANFGITIGGNAVAEADGQSFEKAIRNELFRPLGMRSAFIGYDRLNRIKNRAHLHYTMDGVSKPLFIRDAESEAPGGGINASVRDLAALLQVHLNNGRVGRRQLIDPEVLKQTYEPISLLHPGTYYGICWNISDAGSGVRNINHSGAFLAGARTIISFWPESGIGIAVLTNNFPSLLPEAVANAFYQLYTTGKVDKGTLDKYQKLTGIVFDTSDDDRRLKGARVVSGPIAGKPLSAYAGIFQNAYVGPVEVRIETDAATHQPTLVFHAGPMLKPVKIQRIMGTADLVSTTAEGDGVRYEFEDFENGRFQVLKLPNLKSIGWQKLKRVP